MSNFISVEFFAVARPWRLAMESVDLQSMSLDELWALHETICLILARKLEAEKLSHEQRLNELRRKFGKASNETPERRPYPKVPPKFRNPKPPHQTWSGRGHQPGWVRELLAAGKTIDDLRISTATA
jgi:DNA-binding protein H-NS